MATHCSILAWEIPGTEEPGGLESMGLQRVGPNPGIEPRSLTLQMDSLLSEPPGKP